MDVHQFLARLCALVPPPGFHMTRYYGVLASHHRLREHVIPRLAAPLPPPHPADASWSGRRHAMSGLIGQPSPD